MPLERPAVYIKLSNQYHKWVGGGDITFFTVVIGSVELEKSRDSHLKLL